MTTTTSTLQVDPVALRARRLRQLAKAIAQQPNGRHYARAAEGALSMGRPDGAFAFLAGYLWRRAHERAN